MTFISLDNISILLDDIILCKTEKIEKSSNYHSCIIIMYILFD